MGKYNFDEIIDRRGTSCNKWEYNVPEDVIPMWVADMDFAAAPEIREAMQKRLDCSCSCYESFISDNTWGSYCDHDTCLSSILLFD